MLSNDDSCLFFGKRFTDTEQFEQGNKDKSIENNKVNSKVNIEEDGTGQGVEIWIVFQYIDSQEENNKYTDKIQGPFKQLIQVVFFCEAL